MKIINMAQRALKHREDGKYETMERRWHLDSIIENAHKNKKQVNKAVKRG